MLRLSSNTTLVLRIALPCVYITFFTLFILCIFLIDTNLPLLTNPIFKMGSLAIYVLFIVLLFLTVFRLRRVEYGDGELYVSNYFKNYRYKLEDIEAFTDYNILLGTVVRISLKSKGSWGKHLYFLAKGVNYATFKLQHNL